MWENYSKDINAMYNKLDRLKPNINANKVIIVSGNNKNVVNNNIGKSDDRSLAEIVSDNLVKEYGNK